MAGYSTPAWSNLTAPPINGAAMLALGQAAELGQHPFGVCSTAAATNAKTVTIDFSGTLSLFDGLTVRVQFANGNSSFSPTLNVNGTGAVPISFADGGRLELGENAVVTFVYDGTSWVYNGNDKFLRIFATSYTGNGQYGAGSPNTVNFDLEPIIVIVCKAATGLRAAGDGSWNDSFIWVSEQATAMVDGSTSAALIHFSTSGNALSWYNETSAAHQLNTTGVGYNVFALGR